MTLLLCGNDSIAERKKFMHGSMEEKACWRYFTERMARTPRTKKVQGSRGPEMSLLVHRHRVDEGISLARYQNRLHNGLDLQSECHHPLLYDRVILPQIAVTQNKLYSRFRRFARVHAVSVSCRTVSRKCRSIVVRMELS